MMVCRPEGVAGQDGWVGSRVALGLVRLLVVGVHCARGGAGYVPDVWLGGALVGEGPVG